MRACQGGVIAVELYRPAGEVPFSDRDRAVLDALLASPCLPADPLGRPAIDLPLTRRESDVLNLLKEGFSEKEAAGQLQISIHTLHCYVKKLYRRYQVCSRAELLSRWVRI